MNHIPIRAREQMSKMIASGMTDDDAIHAALQGTVKLLDIRTYRERMTRRDNIGRKRLANAGGAR
ncbi:hypothetical protein WJS89_10475 [Sphingomicrobium sp. XHP0235]|uniref:hypothetical protein n=1 Tax=Sphingomicrobium aquimarinum TaxID=3133971 RepID=UPI0031FEFF04